MAVKIRLARAGAKKRPFYRIVIAEATAPRDGRFIEKVGTYNPMLPKDSGTRVILNVERIKYWLSVGALPTDRVERFLAQAELIPTPAPKSNLVKGAPKKKAQERLEAEKAAAEAQKAAKEAPREAPPLEETEPKEEAPSLEAQDTSTAGEEEAPVEAAPAPAEATPPAPEEASPPADEAGSDAAPEAPKEETPAPEETKEEAPISDPTPDA